MCIVTAAFVWITSAAEMSSTAAPLTVDQVKSDAAKLDRKRVRIAGFLRWGHYGILLMNAADTNAIRIRFPDEVRAWRGKPRPVLHRIRKDGLYEALERACDRPPWSFEAPRTFAVELDATVLVLKSAHYFVFSEAPIEIVPLRVRSFKLLLLPPPPPDDSWWTFPSPLS